MRIKGFSAAQLATLFAAPAHVLDISYRPWKGNCFEIVTQDLLESRQEDQRDPRRACWQPADLTPIHTAQPQPSPAQLGILASMAKTGNKLLDWNPVSSRGDLLTLEALGLIAHRHLGPACLGDVEYTLTLAGLELARG